MTLLKTRAPFSKNLVCAEISPAKRATLISNLDHLQLGTRPLVFSPHPATTTTKPPRNHSRWHEDPRDATVTARIRCVGRVPGGWRDFEAVMATFFPSRHFTLPEKHELTSHLYSPIPSPDSTVVSPIQRSVRLRPSRARHYSTNIHQVSLISAESVRTSTSSPSASTWSPTSMNN